MSETGYLILIIALIAVLAAILLGTFVWLRKTPVPVGCEDLVANKAKCQGCNEAHCPFSHKEEQ